MKFAVLIIAIFSIGCDARCLFETHEGTRVITGTNLAIEIVEASHVCENICCENELCETYTWDVGQGLCSIWRDVTQRQDDMDETTSQNFISGEKFIPVEYDTTSTDIEVLLDRMRQIEQILSNIQGEQCPCEQGLLGEPGPPGLSGPPGEFGADGVPGRDGLNGRDGRDGLAGRDGVAGPVGPPGPIGSSGPAGQPGPPGQPDAYVLFGYIDGAIKIYNSHNVLQVTREGTGIYKVWWGEPFPNNHYIVLATSNLLGTSGAKVGFEGNAEKDHVHYGYDEAYVKIGTRMTGDNAGADNTLVSVVAWKM